MELGYTLNLGFSDEKSCEFKSRLQHREEKRKEDGKREIRERERNPEKV